MIIFPSEKRAEAEHRVCLRVCVCFQVDTHTVASQA